MINNYGEVLENASLENYNTYGIKTTCKYLVKPRTKDDVLNLLEYLSKENIPYYILGKGSNVILNDKPFDGVIISLENLNEVIFTDNIVSVDAGIVLTKFVQMCINNNLKGLEYLALIPGTLGGALYGNAGVKDHSIYDNLESITIIRNGKITTLRKEDINFSYRHTEFKETRELILGATFKLENGNKEELQEIVKENRIKRLNSQPLEYKNAGSVFKNPTGNFAGALIEDCGLKDYHCNDAYVSTKHANFIINKGNATGNDIRNLINIIKEKVYEKHNIMLELEQIILDWD